MPPKVKICGLKTDAALECALEHGADFVGLVFYPRSPRYVSPVAAAGLARRALGKAKTVALLVDPDDALLEQIVDVVAPDMIQLHGHESVDRIREVRDRWSRSVIKAIAVESAEDVRRAASFQPAADILLFDAKPPGGQSNALPGGNGLPFDWDLLDVSAVPRPFMLSGGLTVDNVAAAIATARPDMVDVSSGVERAPGEKDLVLIRRFLTAAKAKA
jgi:phosphoribosylanthranilate isomerase